MWKYHVIDAYKPVPENEEWFICKICGFKPLIWIFDNGRYAKCQCQGKYEGANVSAIDVISYSKENNGSVIGYDFDLLRKKWNEYISLQ